MTDVQVLRPEEGRVVELPAASLLIKGEGVDVADHRIIGELTAQPGFRGPGIHVHSEQAELFYVLDGVFLFTVEGRDMELGPGMTIKIPPGVPHNFANVGDRSARLLVVGASEELQLY